MNRRRDITRVASALVAGGLVALILSVCSSGGVENGRWWLEPGSEITAETVHLDLRVGFVGCSEREVTPDQIVGHTVEYTSTDVIIAVQLDRPRYSTRCCCPFGEGQPAYAIELDEPLGSRQVMRVVGDGPPSPAYEYNY